MIETHELKKRDLYLNKMIAFQDTEPVKVVTGIRRCGKSSLLKLMILHLKEKGIVDDQILEMNFESHAFKNMNSDSFYEYVKQHIVPKKRMYLFFDEVQRVPNWEDILSARNRTIFFKRTGSVILFCPLRFSRSRISLIITVE